MLDEIHYELLRLLHREDLNKRLDYFMIIEAKKHSLYLNKIEHVILTNHIIELRNYGFISFEKNEYSVLPKGEEAYKEFLKKKEMESERKELEFKKLKIDLTNAERVYKTYKSTRLIAWVTFIIAVLLALLRLAEALKLWPFHK